MGRIAGKPETVISSQAAEVNKSMRKVQRLDGEI